MFKIFKRKFTSGFYISIGEEGIVVIYAKKGKILGRLFIKSLNPNDTYKLTQFLNNDQKSVIRIYLNTANQLFLKQIINGLNPFSAAIIAYSKLKNRIPKDYLKTSIFVKKQLDNRSWLYIFAGTPQNLQITDWLAYFLPFKNIIVGTYFLPIELSIILLNLGNNNVINNKIVSASQLKPLLKSEIVLFNCKTNGIRISTFMNGKIIFSNLLLNTNVTNPEVMAGNIEQEVTNTIDSLNKFEPNLEKESITVYIILSENIIKFIRPSKIKAGIVQSFTPHTVALKLGLNDSSTFKDKYFEHILLSYISINNKFVKPLQLEATKKIYLIDLLTNWFKNILYFSMGCLIIIIIINLYLALAMSIDANSLKNKISLVNHKIDDKTLILNNIQSSAIDKLPLEHINEILDLDAYIKQTQENPIDILLKLSQILPSFITVTKVSWVYNNAAMEFFKFPLNSKAINIHTKLKYQVTVNVHAFLNEKNYDLNKIHDILNKLFELLESTFPYAQVTLKNSFSLNQELEIVLIYPINSANLTDTMR